MYILILLIVGFFIGIIVGAVDIVLGQLFW